MKTYTTRNAKNGATLYYSVETGKRIAKETALENERKAIIAEGTTAERYALAKEEVDLTKDGRWEILGKHGVMVMTKVSHDWVSRYEWHYVEEERAVQELAKYNLTADEFRAEVEAEAAREEIMSEPFTAAEAIDATVEAEIEVSEETASEAVDVEEETKYYYTTNCGNVYEVKIGETGSTVRGKWYYYHEIGGLKEADVIELATKSEGNDFANLLCKFIATETDSSEEDSDEEIFNLLPDFELEETINIDKLVDELISARAALERTDRAIAVAIDNNDDTALLLNKHLAELKHVGRIQREIERFDAKLDNPPPEDDETDEPELLGNHPFDNLYASPHREKFSNRFVAIGTDTVVFSGHRISSIKSRNCDAELRFENGRKQFRINGRVIARDKFIAHFENLKLAKEQRSTLHEFFKTVQDNGKFFKAIVDVTLADGRECNFMRTFDYFNQAQDFIQKTAAFTDLPFNAWIARNIQGGWGFYYRADDGTETFNIDEGYRLPAAEIKARVEELQRAIDENRRFENDNNLYAKDLNSAHNIFEANRNMRQAVQLHEFFLHETDAPAPTSEPADTKLAELEADVKAKRAYLRKVGNDWSDAENNLCDERDKHNYPDSEPEVMRLAKIEETCEQVFYRAKAVYDAAVLALVNYKDSHKLHEPVAETQAYEQRIRQVQASCERFSDRHARTKDASRRAYYSRQIERCRNEIAHLQRQINSLKENAA